MDCGFFTVSGGQSGLVAVVVPVTIIAFTTVVMAATAVMSITVVTVGIHETAGQATRYCRQQCHL
jgi:hypothetical protein